MTNTLIDRTSVERRPAGRAADQLRPVSFEVGVQRNAAGSVLISTGYTRVLCAASIEERVPGWMRDQKHERGWVTAEYSMLPGSGSDRIARRPSGRGTEIQRLIGRSLRSVVDLTAIPGRTITLDCDVVDADGGTRTASITGAWVALHLSLTSLLERGEIGRMPITDQLAAISVGIVGDRALLDLDYGEDLAAEVDMNVVASATSGLVEVQGTAEGRPFSRDQLDQMLDLAEAGIEQLMVAQRRASGLEAA